MRFSCLKVTRGSCSSGRNIAPYRANLYASAVLAPGGELVREQSQSQKPVGVGIVASDDERESPMGFLRVERVPLGGDIAAVRICERSRVAARVRGVTVVVLHGRRCGTYWRWHEPGRRDDEHEGEALDGQ